LGDTRLGQGRENAKNFLVQKPEITKEIEQKFEPQPYQAHKKNPETSDFLNLKIEKLVIMIYMEAEV